MRRTISSLGLLLLAACSFGFTGGGLPPDIRTVAVEPFDNASADPTIAQSVNLAVKQAVETRLGLRAAASSQADAVVSGKIVRYDPDMPLAYHGTQNGVGVADQVEVTKRQVELTVDVQVVEQKTGRVLWDGHSQVVQGDYDPGRETDGRRKALDALVKKIIDGVHQNW